MNFISFHGFGLVLKKVVVLLIVLLCITSIDTLATHLRAGEITVTRNDGGCSRNVTIRIRVYTNAKNTDILFGGDGTAILNFGDGTFEQVRAVAGRVDYVLATDGSIEYVNYYTTHNYSRGVYTISYTEPNRNGGVLNMDNSLNTAFYLETTIDFTVCSNPVQLNTKPVDKGCVGVMWTHNAGAIDADGDILRYDLVVPFKGRGQVVSGYKDPSKIGSGLNETGTAPSSFSIDKIKGTITWDAPAEAGEYNIAFVIIELRVIDGVLTEIGRVRRDMQIIIVNDCNERPELEIPEDTCVVAGDIIDNKYIIGTDKEDDVRLEAFSDVFGLGAITTPNIVTSAVFNPPFRPSPDKVKFKWATECVDVREQPYQVTFKVTDKSVNQLATFKAWLITVVGPAPKWKDAKLNLALPSAELEWKPYQCQANAETMQVWRRIDSVAFTPANCQTGMPPNLGYELIAELPIKTANKFTDTNRGKGLAPGATYCYRLVAVYPLPKGGKSYVSRDTCIGPIVNNAPIITNVTVDSTDSNEGKISVRWVKPSAAADSDKPQYKVYRGTGFDGPATTLVYTTVDPDTSFIDNSLNTRDIIYNYKIISNNNGAIDTSAVASSVRLEAQSSIKKIQLNWNAIVPWSNQTSNYPEHFIYRGFKNADGSTRFTDLEPIGTVNVTTNGFTYLDEGPLQDKITYCYAVVTQGAYGNENIQEPLINYSQIICSQTGDSIPPCKLLPPLRSTLEFADCESYFERSCGDNNYRNIIYWNKPEDEECREDVVGYKIYSSTTVNGDYKDLLNGGIVRDTFYIDVLETSFKSCYKIAAVDRSGNIGEFSESLCIDNCPNYELPNVFSPNGDNCNDKFSAYSDRDLAAEGQICKDPDPNGDELKRTCPRFVKTVSFKVYNRWGKEVYSYSYKGLENDPKEGKNGIYIDWNGRDSQGEELATAVYYYVAEVTFDVVDPSKSLKVFKGWIHLRR